MGNSVKTIDKDELFKKLFEQKVPTSKPTGDKNFKSKTQT